MLDDYLSLLSDPEDELLFSQVYRQYRDTVKAAVLQRLNQECDVSDILDSIWAEEARQFEETKRYLSVSGYDAYRSWIGAISMLMAGKENADSSEYQEEDTIEEEMTDADRLLRLALIEAIREDWADVLAEAEREAEDTE